jgi:hypothetical protein
MTPGELAGYVERSRRDQGYPPHVEDVGVLAAVAAMADDDPVKGVVVDAKAS